MDANTKKARAELIAYVKREFAILAEYEAENRANGTPIPPNVPAWKRGARDVLARFLVAIGETTEGEAHAYVGRLIGEDDES